MTVECSNCGDVGPAFYITFGALLIAAIALYFNWVQHREFLRRLRARAEFGLTIKTVDADEHGIRWTSADTQITRVEIGIKNKGKRAAGETVLNVIVPRNLEYARWAGPGGQEVEGVNSATAKADELLTDETGAEQPAMYLSQGIPRISTKPHYLRFVTFPVELPPRDAPIQGRTIPIRVTIQADEIPDEVEEYSATHLVRVRRPG